MVSVTDISKLVGYNFNADPSTEKSARANARRKFMGIDNMMILPEQYKAIEHIAGQYSKTPEELADWKDKRQSIIIKGGYVVQLNLTDYTNTMSDNTLTIPHTLTKLQRLWCQRNKLKELHLPGTLKELLFLGCGLNELKELHVPSTLERLQNLNMGGNPMKQVTVPEELTQLERIYCEESRIPEEVKQSWKDRGITVYD